MNASIRPEIREAMALRFANLLRTLPSYRDIHRRYVTISDTAECYELAQEIMRHAFGFWGQHPILEQLPGYEHPGIKTVRSGCGFSGKSPTCVSVDDMGHITFSPKLTNEDGPSALFGRAEKDEGQLKREDWIIEPVTHGQRTTPYNSRIRHNGELDNFVSGQVIGPGIPFPTDGDVSILLKSSARWFILTNLSRWRLYRVTSHGNKIPSFDVVADVDLHDDSWPADNYFNEDSSVGGRGDFYTRFLVFTPEWFSMSPDDQLQWLRRPKTHIQETPRASEIFGWLETDTEESCPIVEAGHFVEVADRLKKKQDLEALHAYLRVFSEYHLEDAETKVGDDNFAVVVCEMLMSSLGYFGSYRICHGRKFEGEYYPIREENGIIRIVRIFDPLTSNSYWEERVSSYAICARDPKRAGASDWKIQDISRLTSNLESTFSVEDHMMSKFWKLPNVIISTDGLSWNTSWLSKSCPGRRVDLSDIAIYTQDSDAIPDLRMKIREVSAILGYGQIDFDAFRRLGEILCAPYARGRECIDQRLDVIDWAYKIYTFRISDVFKLRDPETHRRKILFGDTFTISPQQMFEIESEVKKALVEDLFHRIYGLRFTHAELRANLLANEPVVNWHIDCMGYYLVTDKTSGAEYICEALDNRNILSCWVSHATDGHGGNAELRALLESKGANHASNFQYSVLEEFGSKNDVQDRLAHWTDLLAIRRRALRQLKSLVNVS